MKTSPEIADQSERELEPLNRQEAIDLYPAFIELAIHGQENKFSTFNSFISLSTVLLAGWTAVFAFAEPAVTKKPILVVFALLGFFCSILWGLLGIDYAKASDTYQEKVKKVAEFFLRNENNPHWVREGQIKKKSKTFGYKLASSRTLIVGIPFCLAVVYAVLLYFSFKGVVVQIK